MKISNAIEKFGNIIAISVLGIYSLWNLIVTMSFIIINNGITDIIYSIDSFALFLISSYIVSMILQNIKRKKKSNGDEL